MSLEETWVFGTVLNRLCREHRIDSQRDFGFQHYGCSLYYSLLKVEIDMFSLALIQVWAMILQYPFLRAPVTT